MAHEPIDMLRDQLSRLIAPRLESLRERVDERIYKVLIGLVTGGIDECLVEHRVCKRLELEETVDHFVVFGCIFDDVLHCFLEWNIHVSAAWAGRTRRKSHAWT